MNGEYVGKPSGQELGGVLRTGVGRGKPSGQELGWVNPQDRSWEGYKPGVSPRDKSG